MTKHISPSGFVRGRRTWKQWCTITVCIDCGCRGHYNDCHPVHPCKECGGRVVERVGRWIPVFEKYFFGLFTRESGGRWQLRGEDNVDARL